MKKRILFLRTWNSTLVTLPALTWLSLSYATKYTHIAAMPLAYLSLALSVLKLVKNLLVAHAASTLIMLNIFSLLLDWEMAVIVRIKRVVTFQSASHYLLRHQKLVRVIMKSFNCLQHVFVFLGQVDTVPTTGTCMRGDGRGYRGTVAVTQSGVPCQSWNSQSPHQHPMAPGLFISDLDDRYNPHHGYCRNPGGLGRQPWCYTTKTTLRWEYCNITKCGECGLFFDLGEPEWANSSELVEFSCVSVYSCHTFWYRYLL